MALTPADIIGRSGESTLGLGRERRGKDGEEEIGGVEWGGRREELRWTTETEEVTKLRGGRGMEMNERKSQENRHG